MNESYSSQDSEELVNNQVTEENEDSPKTIRIEQTHS